MNERHTLAATGAAQVLEGIPNRMAALRPARHSLHGAINPGANLFPPRIAIANGYNRAFDPGVAQ